MTSEATAPTAPLVLVVDDEPSVRKLVCDVLTKMGSLTTVTAEHAGEATELLSAAVAAGERLPDLVVLDVMMPGIDGFAFLAWIRRHEYLFDLPVVMLTARTGQADEGEGWQRGCDAYVRKPFAPRELVEIVRTTLEAGPELRIARRRHRLRELLAG